LNGISIEGARRAPEGADAPGPLPSHDLIHSGRVARVAARLASRTLVAAVRASIPVARFASRWLSRPDDARDLRVLLTGLFLSNAWMEAHVRPLAGVARLGRILIVTDQPMLDIPRVSYVCPPRWLQRLAGRVPARTAWCVLTALRTRPHVVGGFHLLMNGIVALFSARLVGARALYFCVGGWSETWGGGARSENRLSAARARITRRCSGALQARDAVRSDPYNGHACGVLFAPAGRLVSIEGHAGRHRRPPPCREPGTARARVRPDLRRTSSSE
jgi:hypothetical protein